MVIFITDEGRYWNHKNPGLEKYADCVIVICLNGRKVTNKYQCIVVPYDSQPHLGMADYSINNVKFQALKEIEDEIRQIYSYHEDVVFLADSQPQSLYPYLALKDNEEYNNMHLWCMLPCKFEGKTIREEYEELLQDLDKLTSLCYLDCEILLEKMGERTSYSQTTKYILDLLNSILPVALYEIDNMDSDRKYYFDLDIKRYISVDNGYEDYISLDYISKKEVDNFIPSFVNSMLGVIMKKDYPNKEISSKDAVEQLSPRINGKKLCDNLKKMRQEVAQANGISYEVVDCPSTGPCAGTCEKCDRDLLYLQNELMKIPEDKRIYPQFVVRPDYFVTQVMEGEKLLMGYLYKKNPIIEDAILMGDIPYMGEGDDEDE